MIFDHVIAAGIGARTRKLLLAGTALAGAALFPSLAQAQSVWGAAGSTTTTSTYNTGTNWSTGTAPVGGGQSAQFGDGTGGSGGTASSAVSVTAPIGPDSWTFTANSQSYTVTGSVIFATSVTNNASNGASISIANNMTGVTLSQAAASTLTLSGTNSFGPTTVSAGTLVNNGSLTSTVGVSSGGTFSNGASGTVSGAELINLGNAINAGTINNGVGNGGDFHNSGTVNGGVGNSTNGTVTNTGTVNGGLNNDFGTYTQTAGTTGGGAANSGTINANGGAFNGAIVNANGGFGGTFKVGGTVTSDSTFNNSTATSRLLVNTGTYTVTGLITNSGTNASGGILVSAGATLTANGGITNNAAAIFVNNGTTNTTGGLNNAGIGNNSGSLTGGLTNSGTYNQTAGTTSGGTTNTGTVNANGGAFNGAILNNTAGTFTVGGTVTSNSTFTNNGTAQLDITGGNYTGITTLTNNSTNANGIVVAAARTLSATNISNSAGSFIQNSGTLTATTGPITNSGTITDLTGSTLNGGLTNSAGVANMQGTLNGPVINNNTSVFTVTGALLGNSTLTNNGTSQLLVSGGNYTGLTTLTNNSTNASGVVVSAGRTLTATNIANSAGATFANNGITNGILNSNGGTVTNSATGTWNGDVTSNTSSATGITNNGIWNGNVVANTGTIVNNLTWNGTVNNTFVFTNNATGTVTGLVTNTGGGTFSTAGTLSNGLTNAGIVFAQGTINGPIANNGGGINVIGALVANSTFNNAATATINVNNQSFTGVTTYTNAGTTNLGGGGGGTISATSLVNTASGTFNSSSTTSTVTTTSITNSGTFLNNGTTTGTFTMAAGNLSGIGNTQSLTVNGGTFAPGNGTAGSSMTVTGSLVLQAAATYLVQINPTTASFTNVTGAASFNGATVSANFAAGSYISKRYTIVTAAGGVNMNSPFGALVTTGQPANMHSTLSYDTNNAYLDLNLNFGLPGGVLNQNQQNVGNALSGFFNRTGGIPTAFASLTAGQLTQSDGELATGSQQSTFNAMNQFMGVMTDPFVAGRGDPVSAGGGAAGYADEQQLAYAAKRNPNDALAAIYRKAPVSAQRWSVWAAGYGGSQTTNGNAVVGSNTTSSNLYGTAVGADYRLSPDTLAGFALAGGGTNFSVANGLGSGRSDLFQAGAFVRHNMGAAYLSGALAYGWQDITTNRTLTIAGIDQLQAKFNANAWSGRVEGGYRFVSQGIGLTPYAAGQFTTFDLPAYAEQAISGANTFALAYGAKSVTATRSELGLRTDKSFAMEDGVLTLRGRAAWAHDYNPDRAIGATFQTLPGASFIVNGARQASDAVLLTASAEKKWLNGWSAAGTFEGEFSNVTTSYAGKGVVRYSW
ncbi:autotransporter domain-containing protein [Afipia sp. GAS231]|uniref:autotransporter outer membrane beta-barrel domain-containing protein n=1 Tax=Afipia sp. GAS231 TaxID=1882747 RepID=UPI00087B3B22|nr:autotransporter domain-containing protein [Afipia sp. GAS231]SDN72223.1 Uncharacterized conserved protein, contains a C-terminal beta-barrel porin domain [Afipia sp. GAS231]